MRFKKNVREIGDTTKSTKIIRNRRRRGQGLTEYIIIVGLIAMVCVGAVQIFGGKLKDCFGKANTQIEKVKTAIPDN